MQIFRQIINNSSPGIFAEFFTFSFALICKSSDNSSPVRADVFAKTFYIFICIS